MLSAHHSVMTYESKYCESIHHNAMTTVSACVSCLLQPVTAKTKLYKKTATKISLKLPLAFAAQMIKRDINAHYNGVFDAPYKVEDILFFHKHYKDLMTSPESEIHRYIEYLNEKGLDITDPVVFEIKRVFGNRGEGCYMVEYWATGPI